MLNISRRFLFAAAGLVVPRSWVRASVEQERVMTPEITKLVFGCGEAACQASGTTDHAAPAYRYHLACAVASYVQAVVSAPRWAWHYYQPDYQPFVPPTGTEDALASGMGLCGNHAAILKEVFGIFGIPNRTIQLFWNSPARGRQNHIFVELDLTGSGGWGLVDATYGFLAKRQGVANSLLSTAEVRGGVPYDALINNSACQWQWQPSMEHYTINPCDMLVNYTGIIHPYIASETATQTIYSLLTSMPILGKIPYDSSAGNITYELEVPAGKTIMRIVPTGSFGTGQLLINGVAVALPVASGSDYSVSAGPLILAIQSSAPCYIQMDQIVFRQP